ncbi:hypothetical protein [Tabrizicola sp.]|uniref:hypothetical protein n=1 Tax=Tabrizicola sp. TaxID=2005166 RepID=UPI001A5CF37D|nr:hypothetical protein [Tabrizicola sp.]MBL9062591.1 hypothetical protein [Tabrizicola sp.]
MAVGRRKQAGEQLLVRFAEGSDLRSRLEAAAKANNRTVTKEVIHRLEASLVEEGKALEKSQASGLIKLPVPTGKITKLENQLVDLEVQLLQRIETLETRLLALEAKT